MRASSGPSILPEALGPYTFPVGAVGEFLFVFFEKVKDYLGLGSWLRKSVEDGCGRLDLA